MSESTKRAEKESAEQADEFARAAEAGSQGVVREFIGYLGHNKKWWLLPILLSMLVIWGLIAVGGSSAAPFIYTLF